MTRTIRSTTEDLIITRTAGARTGKVYRSYMWYRANGATGVVRRDAALRIIRRIRSANRSEG